MQRTERKGQGRGIVYLLTFTGVQRNARSAASFQKMQGGMTTKRGEDQRLFFRFTCILFPEYPKER